MAHALGHTVLRVSFAHGVRTRYRPGDHHMHLCEAMIALAGPLAELRYRKTTAEQRRILWREYWHIDLDHARHHVQACGADGQWVGHQVRALVGKHWPAIVRVAEQLPLRGELTSSELKALMAGE
jgi:hypothetical protein